MTPGSVTTHHVRETGVRADLHLYCGRKGACNRTDLIDANLGNPHFMADESLREAVCEAYKADLEDESHPHWRNITLIGRRMFEGKSVALYCFCKPKRCHCDEIARRATIQCALLRDPSNPFVPAR